MAILVIKPINVLFNYALLCKLNLAISYYSLNLFIHPHMLSTCGCVCLVKGNHHVVIWFKIIRKLGNIGFIIDFKSKRLIVARKGTDTHNAFYLK